jgi:hypothetical protein
LGVESDFFSGGEPEIHMSRPFSGNTIMLWRNLMNTSIQKINEHLQTALAASERGIEAAKRARATIQMCPLGHLKKDVYQARIRNHRGELMAYRWVCRRCGNFLSVPPWENLIGNPFGIMERSESFRDGFVLDSIHDSV